MLGLPQPRHLHLPLVLNADGSKLSKQNHAPALNDATPAANLLTALRHLQQDCDGLSATMPVDALLHEGCGAGNYRQRSAKNTTNSAVFIYPHQSTLTCESGDTKCTGLALKYGEPTNHR